MKNASFHKEPYDAGTLTKLKIFELYIQEWIPVFTSQAEPFCQELHLFDLFSGPGTDFQGIPGSPLRMLTQLGNYHRQGLAGWPKVKICVHFSDINAGKIAELSQLITRPEWKIPGITPIATAETFEDALKRHHAVLSNPKAAKLLVIDQFGVNGVTDEIFKKLIRFPKTDFMFFVSSSTLNRFREHPAIKIKIAKTDDSYHVHRAAFDHFKKLAGTTAHLGRFSIKKGSNIYGLIFGSQHVSGIHKFLDVAWRNDETDRPTRKPISSSSPSKQA